MDWFEALVLGITQGVTEWLPVSSSGHLALVQRALGEEPSGMVGYDVVLHLATVLVVAAFFWREIVAIVKDWLAGIMEASGSKDKKATLLGKRGRRLGWLIIVASVPTAIIGFLLNEYVISDAFSSLSFLAAGFMATGVLLLLTRFTPRKKRGYGPADAAKVGVAQGIAVLPALSRSGWTVGTSLLLGITPEEAGEFSFLLMIPAVLGASLLRFHDITTLASSELPTILAGAAVAAVVGYACLGLMLKAIRRQRVWWFAPYCLALGTSLLVCILVL